MGLETICAMDMGSRNFKFVIGWMEDGRLKTRLMGKYELSLGKEIARNHGVISRAKMAEMENLLRRFRDECLVEGVNTIRAIATRAIHTAVNGNEVADLARRLGIDVEIADGVREGEVGYLAATGGKANKFVSEMGSQSFQLAWDTGERLESRSLPVGYEFINSEFIGPACHFAEADQAFRSFLGLNIKCFPNGADQFIALAAKAIAGFVTGRPKQEMAGRLLEREAMAAKLRELKDLPEERFEDLKQGMEKAGKILAGTVFLDFLMERTGYRQALIQEAELPVGLIVEHFRDQL